MDCNQREQNMPSRVRGKTKQRRCNENEQNNTLARRKRGTRAAIESTKNRWLKRTEYGTRLASEKKRKQKEVTSANRGEKKTWTRDNKKKAQGSVPNLVVILIFQA
jgi:hypothetical protein